MRKHHHSEHSVSSFFSHCPISPDVRHHTRTAARVYSASYSIPRRGKFAINISSSGCISRLHIFAAKLLLPSLGSCYLFCRTTASAGRLLHFLQSAPDAHTGEGQPVRHFNDARTSATSLESPTTPPHPPTPGISRFFKYHLTCPRTEKKVF